MSAIVKRRQKTIKAMNAKEKKIRNDKNDALINKVNLFLNWFC